MYMLSLFLAAFMFLTTQALASCGCDKPPPQPADIIPHFGWSGSKAKVYGDDLKEFQNWDVTIIAGGTEYTTTAPTVKGVDITDPSAARTEIWLNLTLPSLPTSAAGPAQIVVERRGRRIDIAKNQFTITNTPVALTATPGTVNHPITVGVGINRQTFVSFSGLENVCDAIEYDGKFTDLALRIPESQVVIWNTQGFLLDMLTPSTANFVRTTGLCCDSDSLHYERHDFSDYCEQHDKGESLEVVEPGSDWHADSSPHIDYRVVVVEVGGRVSGAYQSPGAKNVTLNMRTTAP